MLATVTAQRLNVRSIPNVSGRVLGTLSEDAVVDVLERAGLWYEIPFEERSGFVFAQHLDVEAEPEKLRGVVKATLLNVRDRPSSGGIVLGLLSQGVHVKPLSRVRDWLEIEFNAQVAYVSASHVELSRVRDGALAVVGTPVLNVRALPSARSAILGRVVQDTRIRVLSENGGWSEFTFNGARAYVASRYVNRLPEDDGEMIPVTDDDDETDDVIPVVDDEEEIVTLQPLQLLPVSGDSTGRAVAAPWNRFGGLLEPLSDDQGIDVASSVAIMCVESSGKGFEQNNDDRMIIRFENHKFWKYWGKHDAKAFRKCFQYNADKVWRGHKWRKTGRHAWRSSHGDQAPDHHADLSGAAQQLRVTGHRTGRGGMEAAADRSGRVCGRPFRGENYQSVHGRALGRSDRCHGKRLTR